MKVSIIGTAGLPAKYGGFETLAEYLVRNLKSDFEFIVYCSAPVYNEKQPTYFNSKLIYLPLSANGKSSVFYDVISIFHAIFHSKVLLVLGVSGAFMLPIVKFFTSKTVITNIDGLEWKREKWGKLASRYLKWQENIAVKYSDEVIADNEGIKEYVSKEYGKCCKLIAYGGDHASKVLLKEETKEKFQLAEEYAFSVCRIEPENNIHIILDAFAALKQQLVIIGNWEASQYGIDLKKQFSNYKNIKLIDPIYDQDRLDSIRSNCYLYIHGHSAGGTNPSLVEAMWLELPVLCFGVNYNKFTTENQAKYFNSSEQLRELIRQTSSKELVQIKKLLKNIAINNYKWENIACDYKKLFQRKSKN